MGSPERENVAPLGEKILADLDKIGRDAINREKVFVLGDGLSLDPKIISQISEIVKKCNP